MALSGTRPLRSQDAVSVHAHCTEEVTGSEGRERANGVGGVIGLGSGNEDGNGVGEGNWDVNGVGDERTNVKWNRGRNRGRGGKGNENKGGDPRMDTRWERGRERGRKRVPGTAAKAVTGGGDWDGNGDGNRDGSGDGIGDKKENGNGEGRGGEGEVSHPQHKKRSRVKTRHCRFSRCIISADRRWHLQVASSFTRKTQRRLIDVVPRGEQGTRDGREEMTTETGMWAGKGERMGTNIYMRVEGR